MHRIMVNLEAGTGEILVRAAESEKRSLSNFAEVIIEDHLRARGLLPGRPGTPAGAETAALAEAKAAGVDVVTTLAKATARKLTSRAA